MHATAGLTGLVTICTCLCRGWDPNLGPHACSASSSPLGHLPSVLCNVLNKHSSETGDEVPLIMYVHHHTQMPKLLCPVRSSHGGTRELGGFRWEVSWTKVAIQEDHVVLAMLGLLQLRHMDTHNGKPGVERRNYSSNSPGLKGSQALLLTPYIPTISEHITYMIFIYN